MKTPLLATRFNTSPPGTRWSYSDDECFMCREPLTAANRTKEHVFPRWLQERHQLGSEKMTLLNRTRIKYNQLTIPSCQTCNGEHLSRMEKTVAAAFDAGYDAVQALDRRMLFAWLSKVYYGIILKERLLIADRTIKGSGTILTDDELDRFAMHHLLMQTVRGDVVWAGTENPWSIFVVRCQTSPDPQLNFDYIDSHGIPFVAIRIGEVGVIASLQDWGYVERGIEIKHMVAARNLRLHPLQFKELATITGYASSLHFKSRDHVLVRDNDATTILPIPFVPGPPLNFGDGSLVRIAGDLAMHFGVERWHVTHEGKVVTTLVAEDGTPFEYPWDGTANLLRPTLHRVSGDGKTVHLPPTLLQHRDSPVPVATI